MVARIIVAFFFLVLGLTEGYDYYVGCSKSDGSAITIAEGGSVTVTCYVSPAGNSLMCDATNFDVAYHGDQQTSRVTITITAHKRVTSGTVTCTLNAADVNYQNTVFSYTIYYAAYDVSIKNQKMLYYIGDVIACTADAYPEAAYQWVLPNGTYVGSSFTVEEGWRGQSIRMRCLARNYYYHVSYHVYLHRDAYVQFTVSRIDRHWLALILVFLLLILFTIIAIAIYHKCYTRSKVVPVDKEHKQVYKMENLEQEQKNNQDQRKLKQENSVIGFSKY